jgi:ADP-ribose pyrophosphatase YjhB (NUDIX family)
MSDRLVKHVACYALLVRDGRMLLCRLSTGSSAGRWTLPGGGLEFGEHPEETVRREVREETGFQVDDLELVDIWSVVTEHEEAKWHILHFLYRAAIVGGAQANEQHGSTDRCEWFSPDEACSLHLVPLAARGIDLAFG